MPSTLEPSDTPTFDAFFYDGKSAQRHQVVVHLRRHALEIDVASGERIALWAYDEIVFADKSSAGVRVAKTGSEARLVILDTEAFEALRLRAPNLYTQQKRARRGMVMAIALTLAILIGIYAVTPMMTTILVALTPLTFEAKLGQRYAEQISILLDEGGDQQICQGVEGMKALDKLVLTLSQHTSPPVPYHVQVLDVKMVNAVALPGGYIFIFRGLLDQAQSQDELAGVLAHEMAHAQLRHPMRAMVRHYGVSILGDMMFGGSAMGGVSSALMMTSYSREAEQDADTLGLQTLHRANISSNGFTNFFNRLLKTEENSRLKLPGFLSTHPDVHSRAEQARRSEQTGRAVLQDQEWTNLKAVCSL